MARRPLVRMRTDVHRHTMPAKVKRARADTHPDARVHMTAKAQRLKRKCAAAGVARAHARAAGAAEEGRRPERVAHGGDHARCRGRVRHHRGMLVHGVPPVVGVDVGRVVSAVVRVVRLRRVLLVLRSKLRAPWREGEELVVHCRLNGRRDRVGRQCYVAQHVERDPVTVRVRIH